jgi:DNA-binding HxlR family transcriptional regulator
MARARQMTARPRTKAAQQGARRSACPIACALDVLGDKWTLLVVRDLMGGKSYFKEFLASPEKIATNILAERLARLAANGFVERYPASDIAGRDAYRLTEKGRSLRGLMDQIKTWGLKHIDGTRARLPMNY